MVTVKDITSLCKSGKIEEAYDLAKSALLTSPTDVWVQRGMGWALYYLIKCDVEEQRKDEFLSHLEEFAKLEQLTVSNDSFIFNNLLWKIAEFVKYSSKNNVKLVSNVFSFLRNYAFDSSEGYSYLLKIHLGVELWEDITAFIEWWNLEKLRPEDYQEYKLENGRTVMSLAEQAYLVYSKALLKVKNTEKIRTFLPKIEELMDTYSEMVYPGYYCGKLMMAIGANRDEALGTVMPFVRKKKNEFWVWQLLSEMYKDEPDMQLACLLRATRCKAQETFLGKVRLNLSSLYIKKNEYSRAKYHANIIKSTYEQQGWNLPYDLINWLREPWMQSIKEDSSDGLDYKQMTNRILVYGSNESIGVVTYIDKVHKCVFVIYGEKKRVAIRFSNLNIKVNEGTLLKLYWLPQTNGEILVLYSEVVNKSCLKNVVYIKEIEGVIERNQGKPFAFIRGKEGRCFITPHVVENYGIMGGEKANVLAALNYNKHKDEWTWSAISMEVF